MNKTRKSPSLRELVGEADAAVRDLLFARPLAWFADARMKMRDVAKTNFDLGCDFAERNLLNDAIFRFTMVVRFKPDYPSVWYHLGCCYYRKGEFPKAADALKKALVQDPTNRDAIYMLAALEPSAVPAAQRPTRMPKPMVLQFFAGIAVRYDALELNNQYQGGQLVFDALKSISKTASPVVVDLGCGTGIAARPWRTGAKEIIGVDLSPPMLAQANAVVLHGAKLFDKTIEADLAEPLPMLDVASADIVLCINTVSFVGDLAGLVQAVRRVLKPGGLFAITSEAYGHEGFGLNVQTGRFGHSPRYIMQLATQAGLNAVREQSIELYPKVPSQLQIFQAP